MADDEVIVRTVYVRLNAEDDAMLGEVLARLQRSSDGKSVVTRPDAVRAAIRAVATGAEIGT